MIGWEGSLNVMQHDSVGLHVALVINSKHHLPIYSLYTEDSVIAPVLYWCRALLHKPQYNLCYATQGSGEDYREEGSQTPLPF